MVGGYYSTDTNAPAGSARVMTIGGKRYLVKMRPQYDTDGRFMGIVPLIIAGVGAAASAIAAGVGVASAVRAKKASQSSAAETAATLKAQADAQATAAKVQESKNKTQLITAGLVGVPLAIVGGTMLFD